MILKWLAGQFEPEVAYPERTVDILQRFHPDCATLRREVMGFMAKLLGKQTFALTKHTHNEYALLGRVIMLD